MIKRVSNFFVNLVQNYLPQPFILAILLTLIVAVMAIVVAGETPTNVLDHWGVGLWELHAFTMQMILLLIFGYALAMSGPGDRVIKKLCSLPKTKTQAIMLTNIIAFLCAYLNWGFGLIAGALIAKNMAKLHYGKKIHFPLIVAAAYSGNIVRGPSTSIPLVIATPDHFLEDAIGIIPVTETLYTPWNLAITIILLVSIPLLYAKLVPKDEDTLEVHPDQIADDAPKGSIKNKKDMVIAERLENASILNYILGTAGVLYLIMWFATQGFDLDLNIVILVFLALGLLAHNTPIKYVEAIQNSMRTSAGVALQFPVYAGIMGIMEYSGLAEMITHFFISISTPDTFNMFSFWSAGILNVFVPSGGGQWAIQGPIMLPAAEALDVDPARTAMAIAWGDSWTNQIQPFWALPLLAIANLSIRDIMGYCAMVLIMAGVIMSIAFYII